MPFMPLFFICLGSICRITHTPYVDTLSQKSNSEISLKLPVFMTVNIPWETNCGVIAGTIKWTKAMQLRQRKSKTGRINRYFYI